jgi:hypothetical protein
MAKQKPAKTRRQMVDNLKDSVEPPSREAIEKLAYQYWVERGCPLGSPEQDWLRAECDLSRSALEVEVVGAESVEVQVQAA